MENTENTVQDHCVKALLVIIDLLNNQIKRCDKSTRIRGIKFPRVNETLITKRKYICGLLSPHSCIGENILVLAGMME